MGAITDMAITPDGKTVYVATFLGTAVPISTRTGRAGKPIRLSRNGVLEVGGENIIRITPDGKTAYAGTADAVVPIDTLTNRADRPIKVDPAPYRIVFTPDGKTAYVLDDISGVTAIDTATNHVLKRIKVGAPTGFALTPDGNTAYVGAYLSNTVTPISTATNDPGPAINVGQQPEGIAITPDGRTIYVANRQSGTVTVINTRTNAVEKTIKVGKGPWDLLVTP